MLEVNVKEMITSALAECLVHHIEKKNGLASKVDYYVNKALNAAVAAIKSLTDGKNIHHMFSSMIGSVIAKVVI